MERRAAAEVDEHGSEEAAQDKKKIEAAGMPEAVITTPAPKRAISRPANSSDVNGTISGPGAIAMPVFMADQPQAVCSHSATDSSIAPKAAE